MQLVSSPLHARMLLLYTAYSRSRGDYKGFFLSALFSERLHRICHLARHNTLTLALARARHAHNGARATGRTLES